MVGKTGFEPATPWSQTKCSTKLSHFPINGALEGIRTPDLLVRSQTLYPAELRAQVIKDTYNTTTFFNISQYSIQIKAGTPALNFKWWLQVELNHRHQDFQSCALPAEL